MQKTIAQLKTANAATFGNGKDTRGDDEKTFNDDQLDSLKPLEVVISANKTAILGESYVVVASATFTDPSPTEGKGFSVFVRNGTATVGGVAYDTAGTTINRIYHFGSWVNYVSGLGKAWNPALTVDGTVITAATLLTASISYNGNTGTCSLFFDTIASDFPSGTEGFIRIADSEFPIPPTDGHIVSGQFYTPVLVGIKAASGASLRINLNDPTSTVDLAANQLSIVSQFQI